MRALKPLFDLFAHAYWSWALREIDPMHPDLGKVLLKKNKLEVPI